jgi:hypothetical protein
MDVNLNGGQCPQLENAVGWALYALEPEDEHLLRAHLPGCPFCREAVRSTEHLAALIGTTAPSYEPPPALRRRLLAAIEPAPPVNLASRRPVRRSRVLLAAAAAAVLVLGGATTVLGVQLGQLSSQQQAQAAGEAMVQAVIIDPAAKRAVLTNAAGKPAAMLVTSPSGSVVMPLGLAPNAADQQYVAWGLDPAGPHALTSFDIAADSIRPVLVNLPASAKDLTRFAISLEPGRVTPSKPTDVIASGSEA